MGKLILFLIAVPLGVASGLGAYRYIASKARPAHHHDSNRDDFGPGF